MTTETDISLTPDELAFIRAAAARWRMDEAGPMMLEALRKAKDALLYATDYECSWEHSHPICLTALESVRAAIAAAE